MVKTFWFNLFDVILVNREINRSLDDAEVLLRGADNENKDVLNYLFTAVKSIFIPQNVKNSNLVLNVV